MSTALTTEQVCFAGDCALYCLYGLGETPVRVPPRMKRPPFHDLRDALDHIGRLRTTWLDRPGLCDGNADAPELIELIWRLGSGDRERLAALPALRDSLWALLCRLAEQQSALAVQRVSAEWTATLMEGGGQHAKTGRMLDAIEGYHIRRKLRIAHSDVM